THGCPRIPHRPPPCATLCPYTPLFRSRGETVGAVQPRLRDLARRIEARRIGAAIKVHDHAAAGVVLRRDDRDRLSTTPAAAWSRSEEHTSELQSQSNLVCRLLLEKKKK